MDKFKKWLKENKKRSVILGITVVTVIILIIFTIGVVKFLMPNTRKNIYGERCSVTKEYPVESDRKEKIEDFLKDYKNISLKSFQVKCNLIDIVIEVDDKVSLSTVKKMGKEMLSVFSKDELKYYDLELMVKSNNDESTVYPQMGTHHKEIDGSSNDNFIW